MATAASAARSRDDPFPICAIVTIAILAMAIAVLLPFDRPITIMTLGSHVLHVLVVGGMALVGGWLARLSKLSIALSWSFGLGGALAVAACVLMIAFGLARYIAPGVFYAWLYWRRGFITAEVSSVACHLFLQPPFGLLI